MEYVKNFLMNNIIVVWVAPIITTIAATLIIRILSIRKRDKEVKDANKKYADAIRPYIIQRINISEDIIHGIKNAISLEEEIAIKYLYTDQELRDVLIYDITTTRFLTEQIKKELIDHIVANFYFVQREEKTEVEKSIKEINYKEVAIILLMGVLGLVVSLVVYYYNPDEAEAPNSIAQLIIVVSMLISLISMSRVTWKISDLEISIDGIEHGGIIGMFVRAEVSMLNRIGYILFGKRNKENNSEK